MELNNRFRIPTSVERSWALLLDIERVASAMPGARLSSVDGDTIRGAVAVRLGPMRVEYEGEAVITEKDLARRRLVMSASGQETRSAGTAGAIVTVTLESDGDATIADITTSLDVTGRPAQMGAGIMQDVAQKLIEEFARNLAKELQEDVNDGVRTARRPGPELSDEALDLGPAVARALLPRFVPGAIVVLLVLAWVLKRRRE